MLYLIPMVKLYQALTPSIFIFRTHLIKKNQEEGTFMMTISTNYGYGITPQPPERPRSSAGDGLAGAVGTGALVTGLGTGTVMTAGKLGKLDPESWEAFVNNSNVTRFQSKLGENPYFLKKWGAQIGDTALSSGKFMQNFAKTPPGQLTLGVAAATAAIFGISKAWQADQHNEQITKKLQLENRLLSATIPPMDTIL